jgi:hypothetical protein
MTFIYYEATLEPLGSSVTALDSRVTIRVYNQAGLAKELNGKADRGGDAAAWT